MPTIELDGARVACADSGSGETVVLLHATASSRAQWQSLTEALPSGYRILAPDLYGYGESDPWPGNGALCLADEAALVDAVLPLGCGPIHLVGHSYGGAVALRFAVQYPERLRSLVLIEPVAFHLLRQEGAKPADRLLFAEVMEIAGLVRRAVISGNYRAAMAGFIDYWNGQGTWARMTPEQRAALSRRVTKVALDFSAAEMESASAPAYGRIAAPALVLHGARSPEPTRRIAELVADSLPAGRLQIIEGAGHMLPLTHKQGVNTAIAAHLRRYTGNRQHPVAA